MADDSPAVFDTATARGILSRLSRLERKQNGLLGGGYNQAFPQGPLVTRWGKTSTTPDYPTYPSSGNVVGVSLGNYEPSPIYPGATATKTFTAYEPPIYVFATLENGSLPAEGTAVRVTWRNGRWWILQDGGTAAPKCYLHGIRTYRPTTGYVSNNYVKYNQTPGSIYWTSSIGDVSGCNLTINTSSVTAYTDYAIKVGVAGYYEFDWRVSAYDVTADVDKSYFSATTSSDGAQGTHTHTFDAGTIISGNGSSNHTHGGAVAADGATHTHSTAVSGATDAGGSFSAHTHTVQVPTPAFGMSAIGSIRWRASGGAEGDWDLLAAAATRFKPWPCLSESYVGNYASMAPRGILYLAANAELVFRMAVTADGASASFYDDAAAQVVSNAAYTNCTVVYHGASLSTASHYP